MRRSPHREQYALPGQLPSFDPLGDLPFDLPDPSQSIVAGAPTWEQVANQIVPGRALTEQVDAVRDRASAAIANLITPMLGVSAGFAGPVGMAVSTGLSVAMKMLPTIFGESAPAMPPARIEGIPGDSFSRYPFADANRAVVLAKLLTNPDVVTGDINKVQLHDALDQRVRLLWSSALVWLRDHDGSLTSLGQFLSGQSDIFGSVPSSPLTTLGVFAASVPSEVLLDRSWTGGSMSLWAPAMKIMAWGAPRLIIREVLWQYFCLRQAEAGRYVARALGLTESNPSSFAVGWGRGRYANVYMPRVVASNIPSAIIPNLTYSVDSGRRSSAANAGRGHDWPVTRQLMKQDLGTYAARIQALIYPAPEYISELRRIVFPYLPRDLISAMPDSLYQPTTVFRRSVSIMGWLGRIGAGPQFTASFPDTTVLSPVAVSAKVAMGKAFALAEEWDRQSLDRIAGRLAEARRELATALAAVAGLPRAVAENRVVEQRQATKRAQQRSESRTGHKIGSPSVASPPSGMAALGILALLAYLFRR